MSIKEELEDQASQILMIDAEISDYDKAHKVITERLTAIYEAGKTS